VVDCQESVSRLVGVAWVDQVATIISVSASLLAGPVLCCCC
jgi:hypothetical protein